MSETTRAPAAHQELDKNGKTPYGQAFVQNMFRADRKTPPKTLLEPSTDDSLGTENIPQERYFSQEFHNLEVEKVWKKAWQWAVWSQDIPKPGNMSVYDIGDLSILIVRQEDGSLKAFRNACLHRGPQLRTCDGHAPVLRCPYHGWTWNLDGTLQSTTTPWDLRHTKSLDMNLTPVRLEEWNGFAFINLDDNAPPLLEYLEDVPRQFAEWDFSNRFKAAHVVKHIKANWKTVLDAFIEAYHAEYLHPQQTPFSAIEQSEYDVWPQYRHFNRAVTPMGYVSSSAPYQLSEQEVVNRYIKNMYTEALDKLGTPEATVAMDETARDVLTRIYGRGISQQFGVDLTHLDSANCIDAVWYFIFPNFEPWPTLGYPLFYRFRPYGNNPDESLMDIMILSPFDGERPPSAKPVYQGPEDRLEAVLGKLGAILDQDVDLLPQVQRGMKSLRKEGMTLTRYQESRIRHYHRTLMEYINE